MAKKMTLKEFKQVLSDAGIELEYWGYEGILNKLCIAQNYMIQRDEEYGAVHALKRDTETRDVIHEALADRGYYD